MRIKFFQNFIDLLKGKSNYRPLIIYPKMLKKLYSFENKKNCINTLILGSSHAEYGYRAKKNEINLAISYQDLYYSCKIYEKMNNENVKNIILFYSVFSPGNQLINTQDAYLAIAFKLLFDIEYQDKEYAIRIGLNKLEKKYKNLVSKFAYNEDYYGNEEEYISYFSNIPPEKRAIPHYKNNQRHNNQTKYIIEMSKLAKKFNQTIFVVISPATENYKSLLPSSDVLFSELYSTVQNLDNVKLINCYDTHFENNEFVDWDHLNLKGAERLTNIINSYIAQIRTGTESNIVY